jgi:hypothetical protein
MLRRDFLRLSAVGGVALAPASLSTFSARAASASYPFGTSLPSFSCQEILVYRLQVTRSTWACSYLSTSGSYTRYGSISALISDLQGGTLGSPDGALPSFGSSDVCPDIIVREPCYVVVVLSSNDDSTLAFQSYPITTGQNRSSRYYSLTEPYADSDGAYRVCYFAVPSPATSAIDPYSMYLQYGSGPTLHTIDPGLKNRGPGQ